MNKHQLLYILLYDVLKMPMCNYKRREITKTAHKEDIYICMQETNQTKAENE